MNSVAARTCILGCLLATGCALDNSSSLVFPNSQYIGTRREESVESKVQESLDNDPYLCQALTRVQYEWQGPPLRDVAAYYGNLLSQLGWQRISGLSDYDKSLCGGDWGGVYRKGKHSFKLQACGLWDKPKVEEDGIIREYPGRGFINFYFIDSKPEAVLGRHFAQTPG